MFTLAVMQGPRPAQALPVIIPAKGKKPKYSEVFQCCSTYDCCVFLCASLVLLTD